MPHGKRSRKRKPQVVHDFGFLDDDSALLLDRRDRLASDVPIRLERGSRQRSALAPSPAREAAQLHAVRRLGELFERRCACLGAKHCHKAFEAWLWAVRAESESEIVPIVPQAQASSVAQAELRAQLVKAGLAEAHARDACNALASCAARLADELRAGAAEAEVSVSRELLPRAAAAAKAAGGGGSGSTEEEGGARLLQLSCAGEAVVVADSHLCKLWSLWQANGAAAKRRRRRRRRLQGGKQRRSAEAGEEEEEEEEEEETEEEEQEEEEEEGAGPPRRLRPFLASAYCSLARLLALQGGDERSGGMQAACPAPALEELRATFGVRLEVFASPLNCICMYRCMCTAYAHWMRTACTLHAHCTHTACACTPPGVRLAAQLPLPTLLLRCCRCRRALRIALRLLRLRATRGAPPHTRRTHAAHTPHTRRTHAAHTPHPRPLCALSPRTLLPPCCTYCTLLRPPACNAGCLPRQPSLRDGPATQGRAPHGGAAGRGRHGGWPPHLRRRAPAPPRGGARSPRYSTLQPYACTQRCNLVCQTGCTPTNQAGWRALHGAAHMTCEVVLPRSKHAYIDGGQHYGRRGRRGGAPLRLSNHDSSVFFLQSRAAAAAAAVTPDKQQRIIEAFRGGG